MKEVDALGKPCPIPVVLTKRQMDAGESLILTKVDNVTAVENLMRLAESQGYSATLRENDGCYEVMLSELGETRAKRGPLDKAPPPPDELLAGGLAVFVAGEHLGEGDRELGATLMNLFFFTMAEGDEVPTHILFLNGGVKLPVENSEVIGHLKKLEERGSEILVCGACLNYYGLKEKLQVGQVSNMYEILLRLQSAAKVVRL